MRLALGASRARLVRQFALEAALLVAIAVGLATIATPSLVRLIVRALPPEITLGHDVSADVRAFGFSTALSAVGLLLFTLLPVDLVRRSSPIHLLRGHTVSGARRSGARIRTMLFVGQLGIAASLAYLAGLTLHSFVRVSDVQLGFQPEGLWALRMPRGDAVIPATGRERLDRQRVLVGETIRAVRGLPGVSALSGSHSWPMQDGGLGERPLLAEMDLERRPQPGRQVVIGRGYPDVIGVRLVEGAEPSDAELADIGMPPRVQAALANQTLARHLEAFGPPIGQIVATTSALRYRIVGVIPDVVLERPDRPVAPTLFHYLPPPAAPAVALVRLQAGRTPQGVGIPTVLERIWGTSAPPVFPVTDAVRRANADYRARTLMLALICLLTVPLTMAGVGGALSYAIRQRTRVIAIELALGADPRLVARRVVRQAVAGAAWALVAGIGAGMLIGRLMSASLFGIAAADARSVAGSVILIVGVAAVAALLPARRAARISPADALRET